MTERRVDGDARTRVDALIAEYTELITHVKRLVRRMRVAVVVVLVGFAVGGYSIVALIDRNKKSILVSCTLIANVATDAGAAGTPGKSKAAQTQQKITALAFDVIIRSMTPTERKRLASLNDELSKAGGFVTLPDCQQVSEDPESVKQPGGAP